MNFEDMKSTIGNLKSEISTPYSLLVVMGALAVLGGLWWIERDANLRREGALKEMQKQTDAEVAALRARADQAVRDAQQANAQAAAQLDASRRAFEQQSQELARRMEALQQVERTRVAQVATLSPEELYRQLGERLGPGAVLPSAISRQPSEKSEIRNQKAEENRPFSVLSSQFSVNDKSGIQITTAEPKAAGDGQRATDNGHSSITQSPDRPIAQSNDNGRSSSIEDQQSKIENGPDTRHPNPDSLTLSESGARQVETAFVELASCREQAGVREQQWAACDRERQAEQQMVAQQKSSIAQLNQALTDKDRILAKRESEFKAELKVARGTFLSRVSKTAMHVAIGVALGLAVR